jgi:small nuclear ribonucleoprotein (snRNP)-like protein
MTVVDPYTNIVLDTSVVWKGDIKSEFYNYEPNA